MNSSERFNYLLDLYIKGTISYKEHDELFGLIATGDYQEILNDCVNKHLIDAETFHSALPDEIASDIVREIVLSNRRRYFNKSIIKYFTPLLVAATLLVLFSFGYYFFLFSSPVNTFAKSFLSSSTTIDINNTEAPLLVSLPDGSKVTLKPKSGLYYSKNHFSKSREVYLKGEAYFQVAKVASKPFYVYCNQVVTKVLGTSFTVSTNRQTGNIEVAVLTGKVQVYENEKVITSTNKRKTGLILTPNQKATYEAHKLFFQAALVDNPAPVLERDDETIAPNVKIAPFNFSFEHAKMSHVIKELQQCYGIDIVLSNDDINNCVFNGDVTAEGLYDKLKIICLATNSAYEVSGTKILIKGVGCKP